MAGSIASNYKPVSILAIYMYVTWLYISTVETKAFTFDAECEEELKQYALCCLT